MMFARFIKFFKFFLILVLAVSWIFSGWPQIWKKPAIPPEVQEVRASNTVIRQEINIIDGIITASGDDSSIIQLDTTKYSGAAYYFETVAMVSSGTLTVALERVGTATQDATISVTAASFAIQRSEFTPPASAQTEYNINLANGTGPQVKAARIIIIQGADPIASTQTQIEIGNKETGKTNTTTNALTSPKYWYYDSSKWDPEPTFSVEVTYKDYQVASSTYWTTAGTYTNGYVVSPGTSYAVIEAWGAGGGGGDTALNTGGGGGGGGAYACSTTTPAVASLHTLVVGAGGTVDIATQAASSTYDVNIVGAEGGMGTDGPVGGAKGLASSSYGQIKSDGGAGGDGNGSGDLGGGGGGAGGPNGAGNNGTQGTSGVPGNGGSGDAGSATGGATQLGVDGQPGAAGNPGTTGGGGGAGGDDEDLGVGDGQGGAGGAPGGGGGGGNVNTLGKGADGQIKITETHGMVGIALEQDDGSFGAWTNVAQIVTDGVATSSPSRVRVSFSPSNGKNYRLVASTTDATASYDIYNAKIIVDQESPTKFETQYLLANTLLGSGTGLQNFLTSWNSAEWTTSNTYIHEVNAANDSSSVVEVDTSGGSQVDGSQVGTPDNREQSSSMTMPSNGNLDVKATTNYNDIYSSRILVQATFAFAPTIPSLSFNASQDITLAENSYIWASSTLTVSDNNGCNTISTVTASFKLASSTDNGSFCSYDGNTCYEKPDVSCVATTTGNTCDGGVDTSAEYDCGFQIWYLAEPTNASAPIWSSSIWVASATATDSGALSGTATNTAENIEVNAAAYLSVTGTIDYGELSPGDSTGTLTNSVVNIINTGNFSQDTEISGHAMCIDWPMCTGVSAGYMAPGEQKFDHLDDPYVILDYTLAATTSPETIETFLDKPISTGTPIIDVLYFGIKIPDTQKNGDYTGQNIFSAVPD